MTILEPETSAKPVDLFVGVRLRELRKERGMTQQALGEAIGVTFQQVQKYERGSNRLSASTMAECAKALGVQPWQFFAGMPDFRAASSGPTTDHLSLWLASAEGQAWSRVGFALGSGRPFDSVLTVAQIVAAG